MKNSSRLGLYGEDLACFYLQRKGYSIDGRNVMVNRFEIDIIAKKDELTVFVEVKTRANEILGPAQDQLTAKKLKFIKRAALLYCLKNRLKLEKIRLDFIAIDIKKSLPYITHFEEIA